MRASVVLPLPGGPQKIIDGTWSLSMRRRSMRSSPTRCSCPTNSSKLRGRIRAASGASRSLRARAFSSNMSGRRPLLLAPGIVRYSDGCAQPRLAPLLPERHLVDRQTARRPERSRGRPTGMSAIVSMSSGMSSSFLTSASCMRWSVVIVQPRPRARAASIRFCTAGKIDEPVTDVPKPAPLRRHHDEHRRFVQMLRQVLGGAIGAPEPAADGGGVGSLPYVVVPGATVVLADAPLRLGVADDDEVPGLTVAAAGRHRRRFEDRPDVLVADGLVG